MRRAEIVAAILLAVLL